MRTYEIYTPQSVYTVRFHSVKPPMWDTLLSRAASEVRHGGLVRIVPLLDDHRPPAGMCRIDEGMRSYCAIWATIKSRRFTRYIAARRIGRAWRRARVQMV